MPTPTTPGRVVPDGERVFVHGVIDSLIEEYRRRNDKSPDEADTLDDVKRLIRDPNLKPITPARRQRD